MVIEEESEIITAIETTPANTDDGSQLKPLLNRQEETHDIIPEEISGDKAYDRGANLEYLESKHITGYISLSSKMNVQGTDLFTVEDFTYDETNETLTCPAGVLLPTAGMRPFIMTNTRETGTSSSLVLSQCNACELKALCHKVTGEGRLPSVSMTAITAG